MKKLIKMVKKLKEKTNRPPTWWDYIVYLFFLLICCCGLCIASKVNFERLIKRNNEPKFDEEKEVDE